MEFLFNDYFMWCMFVCHRVLSIFRHCSTAKLPVISFDVVAGFFLPSSLTHTGSGFYSLFPVFFIFYSIFFCPARQCLPLNMPSGAELQSASLKRETFGQSANSAL